MTIGPIVIRWKQDVEHEQARYNEAVVHLMADNRQIYSEQAQTQRITMRQNRVIAGLTKDNDAMRHTLEKIIEGMGSRRGKTPSRVGQTV